MSSTSGITPSLPLQLPGGSAVTLEAQGPAGGLVQEGLGSDRSVLRLSGWGLAAAAAWHPWVSLSQPFWGQQVEGAFKETAPLPQKCGFPGDFLADVRQCTGKTSAWNLRPSWEGVVPIQKGALFKSWVPLGPPGGGPRGDGGCGMGWADAVPLPWQGEGAETRPSPVPARGTHPAPVLSVPAPCEESVAPPCPRQEVQQSPRSVPSTAVTPVHPILAPLLLDF